MVAVAERPSPALASSPAPAREWARTSAIALVPVGVAVALALFSHAWGTARTDDWSFARTAFALHATGHLQLIGWAQMNLVGLVAWAQPWLWLFGDHQWVLDLSTVVLVAIGLAAAFRLARGFVARGTALVAIGSLIVFPGLLRDTTTFMTDAPAVAVQAVVLAVGAAALRATGRRRALLLVGVLLLGFWGFTIREFAIAAPLAVLGAAYFAGGRRRRTMTIAVGFVAACGAFYVWRQGLPGAQTIGSHPTAAAVAATTVAGACTACLGLVPALAWTARSWWHSDHPRDRLRGCVAGATLMCIPIVYARSVGQSPEWLLGHYLDKAGINGNVDTLGVRPQLLPNAVWGLLSLAAIAAALLVCGLLVEWLRTRRTSSRVDASRRMLTIHVGLVAASVAAAAVLNGQLFDRYLWAIVLSGSILIVGRAMPTGAPHPRTLALTSMAILCAVTVALTLNSDAFDSARVHAAQQLVSAGLAPSSIDAGFEWMGAHSTGVAQLTGGATTNDPSFWSSWYPHPPICAIVTASAISLPGFALQTTTEWNLLLVAGAEHLSTYRSLDPRCPPP